MNLGYRVGRWLLQGPPARLVGTLLEPIGRSLLSTRTLRAVRFDLLRARARRLQRLRGRAEAPVDRLHFGSGGKKVPGWLNVDVADSDFDVDLAGGRLPWPDDSFSAAVGQQVIEHLELHEQLLPLLRELARVLRPGGELWVSCPDIEKVCRAYVEDRMQELIAARERRFPGWSHGSLPTSHLVNDFFHQRGEHQNLFDFPLLEWALRTSGFDEVERVGEAELLDRFDGFPARGDEDHALYVKATAPSVT